MQWPWQPVPTLSVSSSEDDSSCHASVLAGPRARPISSTSAAVAAAGGGCLDTSLHSSRSVSSLAAALMQLDQALGPRHSNSLDTLEWRAGHKHKSHTAACVIRSQISMCAPEYTFNRGPRTARLLCQQYSMCC